MQRGFTIVELLVSIALFVTVFTIATGSFIQSWRSQRITAALIAANSNASLAMEQMAREMRTGRSFSQSGNEINFINAKGEGVFYRWNAAEESLERSVGGLNFKKITADNVRVKNLNFRLFEGSPADPYPSRITLSLQVGAANTPITTPTVNLQTTVSSRVLQ